MAESFDLGALIGEFRDEARDQLDRVDAGLLEIEREGMLTSEVRSALLRTLHTLKGNAGMLGLSPIRDFAHVLENVLKAEAADWPDPLVERLFKGVEALRAAIEASGSERQPEAFRKLSAARHRLEELDSTAEPPVETADGDGVVEESPAAGDLIRIPFTKLDSLMAEVGDLLGEAVGLEAETRGGASEPVRDLAHSIHRRADVLRESIMSLRLVPLNRVVGRFHALVRRIARQQGKEARLVVEGEGTEVDKSTADALAEPLLHLVRNAVDHGIRPPADREAAGKPRHGTVRISATQSGDRVRIEVEDDGAGLDLERIRERGLELQLIEGVEPLAERELIQLIFEPGFSTREDVSTVSGRGVGLDVVSQSVRELRGELSVERPENGGTRFILSLPLTVAVIPSLVFEAAGELLAVPTTYVARTLALDHTERVGATEVIRADGELYPIADPDRLFAWPAQRRGEFGVLLRREGRSAVLRASHVVDQRDLVVKKMPRYGRPMPLVSGGSVLPGGQVILMLDPAEVIRLNEAPQGGGARAVEE